MASLLSPGPLLLSQADALQLAVPGAAGAQQGAQGGSPLC